MGLKEKVLALLDPLEVWATLFEGWKPGVNVPCVVAEETHEKGADSNPSMSLSQDGKAYCHACGFKATSPIGLLADMEKLSFKEACKEAYHRFVSPLVPETYIKECHIFLLKDKYLLTLLQNR